MSNLVQYPFGESVYLDFVHWDMLWIAFVIDVTVQCWCYGTQKRNKSKKKKKKNKNKTHHKKNGPPVAKTFHTRTAWKQFFTEFQQFFSLR